MEWHSKKALILGTGGASKAVEYVLKQNGIQPQFVSRKANQKCLAYSELTTKIIADHPLIINCTPLGTFPNIEDAPAIDYSALGHNIFV